mgnify:CR=1 FL=1
MPEDLYVINGKSKSYKYIAVEKLLGDYMYDVVKKRELRDVAQLLLHNMADKKREEDGFEVLVYCINADCTKSVDVYLKDGKLSHILLREGNIATGISNIEELEIVKDKLKLLSTLLRYI